MRTRELDKITTNLKNSPLFNLSLSSKELFHSNFIAWLADTYPKQIGKFFSKYLKVRKGNTSIKREGIKREEKNIDIRLSFENGQELIIENKVRSLPYIEQLEGYSKDPQPNQNFLLLTLVEPYFVRDGKIKVAQATWHTLSYSELSRSLKKILPRITNVYHKQLIGDYISFIISLSELFKNILISGKYVFDSNSEEIQLTKVLNDLRIADLYGKFRFQTFALNLYRTLDKTYPKQVVLGAVKEMEKGKIYISSGMMHSEPLLDLYYCIEPGLSLMVQFQGHSYNQMVLKSESSPEEFADKLKKRKLWFNFRHVNDEPSQEYPRGNREFKHYGDRHYYRSVNVKNNVTVEQLISYFLHDAKWIRKNMDKIVELI